MKPKPTWAEVRESLRALTDTFESLRVAVCGLSSHFDIFRDVMNRARNGGKATALLLFASLLTGCVQTQFTAPNGATFKTTRVLWQGEIGKAEVLPDGSASIEAYKSEAEKIAEAVAGGVAKGLKP